MTSYTNSNGVLTRKEKEELVLDLYLNQNKTYHEIAKIARMSPRDIKPIIDKAINEKERTQHKTTAVQAYNLFSQGKTLLEVTIDLNLGQAQATAYYGEYLKIVGLDNVIKIYQELGVSTWDFIRLCKEAKAAKMGVPQVINLLRIANYSLPSVQRRYQTLHEHNNRLESILKTKSEELQHLNDQIIDTNKNLDTIKSEYRREAALLQGLRQHIARLEGFMYNYKNNNEDYIELIKSIEDKVRDLLSDKKGLLKTAIISLIESMRNNPEKYSALVYHNNYNQNSSSSSSIGSKDHNSNLLNATRQAVVLPPPPYDDSIIEYYKGIMLEEAEKLYNVIVDQVLCEVVNENVANQSTETMPSSLPALPLEEGGG
jgi:DNA repair exonuclease SbcCD ATPase subunit